MNANSSYKQTSDFFGKNQVEKTREKCKKLKSCLIYFRQLLLKSKGDLLNHSFVNPGQI